MQTEENDRESNSQTNARDIERGESLKEWYLDTKRALGEIDLYRPKKIKCPKCGSDAGFIIEDAIVSQVARTKIAYLSDGAVILGKQITQDACLDVADITCLNCGRKIEDPITKFALEVKML